MSVRALAVLLHTANHCSQGAASRVPLASCPQFEQSGRGARAVLFGLFLLLSYLAGMPTAQAAGIYDVRDYGAKGDGVTKDTVAIQSTINAAAKTGGVVRLSGGRFVSGTLRLQSHVTLEIENGATLVASPDRADFDPYEPLPYEPQSDRETSDFHLALVRGQDVQDVAVVGQGTIDANRTKRGDRAAHGEPKPLAFKNCQNVTFRDITVQNAPNYSVSLLGCDFVNVDGVRVLNGFSDGIDPDCCRFVRIQNCYVECYDDGICLKSSFALGKLRATENVTITNCQISSSSNAIKMGTESNGGFRNVTISNCVFFRRLTGREAKRDKGGLAIETVNGGAVDRIVVTNLVMHDVAFPLFIRLGDQPRGKNYAGPGTLENLSLANIVAIGSEMTSSITGLPGHPVRNVALDNVRIVMAGGVTQPGTLAVPEYPARYPEGNMFGILPAYGLYCRHVEGLTLRNLRVGWQQRDVRPALIVDDAREVELEGLVVEAMAGNAPVVWLNDVVGAFVQGCRLRTDTALFLKASGGKSQRLTLVSNDLGRAAKPWALASEVPASAVREASNLHSP